MKAPSKSCHYHCTTVSNSHFPYRSASQRLLSEGTISPTRLTRLTTDIDCWQGGDGSAASTDIGRISSLRRLGLMAQRHWLCRSPSRNALRFRGTLQLSTSLQRRDTITFDAMHSSNRVRTATSMLTCACSHQRIALGITMTNAAPETPLGSSPTGQFSRHVIDIR